MYKLVVLPVLGWLHMQFSPCVGDETFKKKKKSITIASKNCLCGHGLCKICLLGNLRTTTTTQMTTTGSEMHVD